MAFRLLVGTPERDHRQQELLELQRKYDSLYQRFDHGKTQYDELSASNTQDKIELYASRDEIINLQGRVAGLEKELQACKDDLFRLQPVSQVPDSSITERFEDLDNQICDWIDASIKRALDSWRRKYPDEEAELFRHNDGTIMEFLSQYPDTAGEYVIRQLIHQYFLMHLWNEELLLFGLDLPTVRFLQYVEQGMTYLHPPKDAATLKAWRSDTLASLAASSSFTAQLNKARGKLANELFEQIQQVFPRIRKDSAAFDSLYNKVIMLAVGLAIDIQTSTTSYMFKPQVDAGVRHVGHAVPKADLGQYRMTDVATGKALKANSLVATDRYSNIGNCLMVLVPALFRRDDDKLLRLTQEIFLIELYEPLGKR